MRSPCELYFQFWNSKLREGKPVPDQIQDETTTQNSAELVKMVNVIVSSLDKKLINKKATILQYLVNRLDKHEETHTIIHGKKFLSDMYKSYLNGKDTIANSQSAVGNIPGYIRDHHKGLMPNAKEVYDAHVHLLMVSILCLALGAALIAMGCTSSFSLSFIIVGAFSMLGGGTCFISACTEIGFGIYSTTKALQREEGYGTYTNERGFENSFDNCSVN